MLCWAAPVLASKQLSILSSLSFNHAIITACQGVVMHYPKACVSPMTVTFVSFCDAFWGEKKHILSNPITILCFCVSLFWLDTFQKTQKASCFVKGTDVDCNALSKTVDWFLRTALPPDPLPPWDNTDKGSRHGRVCMSHLSKRLSIIIYWGVAWRHGGDEICYYCLCFLFDLAPWHSPLLFFLFPRVIFCEESPDFLKMQTTVWMFWAHCLRTPIRCGHIGWDSEE